MEQFFSYEHMKYILILTAFWSLIWLAVIGYIQLFYKAGKWIVGKVKAIIKKHRNKDAAVDEAEAETTQD